MIKPAVLALAAGLGALMFMRKKAVTPSAYDQYFTLYSYRPDWAKAVATVESSLNPNARGTAGEMGLMQIKPSTAGDLGFYGDPLNLLDPRLNVYYGSMYLDQMVERFGLDLGIQAYNVGPGAVSRGTRNIYYLEKVYNARRAVTLAGWDPGFYF